MARDPALAKIHIARKELGLSEENYRALLARVAGAESAASLTASGKARVLAEFERLGWQKKARSSVAPGGRAHVGKVLDLWREAVSTGIIQNGSEEALRSFVRRQTKSLDAPDGVAAPQFLTPKQANRVIEGLKAMLARGRA